MTVAYRLKQEVHSLLTLPVTFLMRSALKDEVDTGNLLLSLHEIQTESDRCRCKYFLQNLTAAKISLLETLKSPVHLSLKDKGQIGKKCETTKRCECSSSAAGWRPEKGPIAYGTAYKQLHLKFTNSRL